MKKSSIISCIFPACWAIFFMTACVVNGDKNDITAPTIRRLSDTNVAVSFNSLSGMSYANIFRQRCDEDSKFNTIKETVNIGQVIPANTGDLTNSFNFIDEFVTSGSYYRYFIRYYKDNYYSYTGYSPAIQNTAGVGEAELIAKDEYDLVVTDAKATYHDNKVEDSYMLELNSSLLVPTSADTTVFTDIYYVISNGTSVKPYRFAEADKDTKEVAIGTKTNDMRIFLLESFLGKTIYVNSLIAVKKTQNETNTDKTNPYYNSYYWTKPKGLKIFLDETYRDSSGKEQKKQGESIKNGIYVPKIDDRTNSFDYNPSTKMIAPTRTLLTADDGAILDISPCNP